MPAFIYSLGDLSATLSANQRLFRFVHTLAGCNQGTQVMPRLPCCRAPSLSLHCWVASNFSRLLFFSDSARSVLSAFFSSASFFFFLYLSLSIPFHSLYSSIPSLLFFTVLSRAVLRAMSSTPWVLRVPELLGYTRSRAPCGPSHPGRALTR